MADGLAVDGSHIYWARHFWIGRANLDGSGVRPEFIDEYNKFFEQTGVAVQGGHVYWSHLRSSDEQTWIGRANVNGTGIDPTFIDPHFGSGEAIPLATDSAHLYYEGLHGVTRANLDGSGADANFLPGAGRSLAVNSSHVYWGYPERSEFRFHKPIRHKRRGTATLPLDVFGPGALVLSGKGLQTVTRTIESGTALDGLPVRPKGRKKRTLERRGHVNVTADVTFTLTGADPTTQSKSLRLVER